MAKIYSKNSIQNTENLKPKDETISFLLNYSKALKVVKGQETKFDILLN
ncbi:hypothetical protein SAMN05421824_1731 [Hyunsoonleella jejuensis]|uniref:Uncharacterized protein n=1 Tax=Hyunsoonleella jejuensis TaxID=419940 RepID=A0A1H9G9D6_9FLAO|nr:hypothetical protein [Hyunsoonleella jejuensis]SEQ46680.1 hypothetical protein SAMN05421824_1731 [Hyunsoonleella jejuensis]